MGPDNTRDIPESPVKAAPHHSLLLFAMRKAARVPVSGSDSGILHAEGIFFRKRYCLDGKTGSLYIPKEMKKDVSEEKLLNVFMALFGKYSNFAYHGVSGYDSKVLLAEGAGVHIRYRVDNCERGFFHVPEKLKTVLTAEKLTDIVKDSCAGQEMSFILYCDGFPCPPEAKLAEICTEKNPDNLVISSEPVNITVDANKMKEMEKKIEDLLQSLQHSQQTELVNLKKMAEMAEKNQMLEKTNVDLQKSLQKSQAAADQWTLLMGSMEKMALMKLLEDAAQNQQTVKEDSIKKADYLLEEVRKCKTTAAGAEEQLVYIQKLMDMVSAYGEKKDPLKTVSDQENNA